MNQQPFDRGGLRDGLASLAARGVYVGTSSWKYPGWRGMLYEEDRYIWRGRFSESRFERSCLAEYAEVFKTVCVDAAYYKFPDRKYLFELVSQVPEDFLFTLKVTDDITIKKFGNLPRFGVRAGKSNENFLNAELFEKAFLRPCEEFKRNIGMMIFEFSKFYASDYEQGRDFMQDLDGFLGKLPKGWQYGIEIRNKNFLKPEYFELLRRHDVAHVFNSWSDMPSVEEQLALAGSVTSAENVGARFLLRPGRKYQEAVDLFQPYTGIKDAFPGGRAAAIDLIKRVLSANLRRKLMLYVNNRLEGNALLTIRAILDQLGEEG